MLMNHKNFHFTQIPDKTNDIIFLKSPKTMFLGHFWQFSVIIARWGFFPKNPAVTQNYIWAPNTMLSFRKNIWTNPEKTYRQTEGRTDLILQDPSGRGRGSNKEIKCIKTAKANYCFADAKLRYVGIFCRST